MPDPQLPSWTCAANQSAFPSHPNVQPCCPTHLALEGGGICQLWQHNRGPQVGKGVERGAQAQQALLGALRVGQGVPLVAAESGVWGWGWGACERLDIGPFLGCCVVGSESHL